MKISKNKIVNQIHKKLLKDRTKILEVRQRLVDKNYFTYQPKAVELCSDGSQIVDTPYAEELVIYIKYKG
jgi:hypothetical protein